MSDLTQLEKRGTAAVRKLRLQKLKNGHPFMINSKDLISNQCYLEYPDGIIKLVGLSSSAREFNVIRELTSLEANVLRTKFQFYI